MTQASRVHFLRYNAGMNILQNVPLKLHSTMRLGGSATYLTEVHNRHELVEAYEWVEKQKLPVLMIGGGSNIIWRDEGFPGLVMVNKIMGYEEQQEDDENFYIHVGAGENWDDVVGRATEKGMTGIEALSLIPGTAGATPVQNVGAYGQEVAQTLVSVEAYDTQLKQFVTIPSIDCAFSYRSSRFKTTDRGRFFITGLTFHLLHANPQPPFYRALDSYFAERHITNPTPQMIREAVIAIRQSRLPDPAKVANNGSFFANPIIDEGTFAQIQADHPGAPHWPTDDGRIKLPAAWLMEQAGFKDVHDPETGMGTWPVQCLVLVNEHAQSTAQLLAFRQKIIDGVQQRFDVTLVQEPELLP
jgi:UDP-N-acetylmuramate dehydrogenase